MTRLIEVPTQFDDRSFDQFAAAYAQAVDGGSGERLLFDAHAAEWASPYGLVGLLAAGEAAARKSERALLTAPANPDVVSYWARAGFFREAADLFEVHGKVPKTKVAAESDVLLPVTPVRAAEDVHAVVSTIQQRASAILSSELDSIRRRRWASLWRFRSLVRILWSTPAPAVGSRCRRTTGGASWRAVWW